MWCNLFYDKYAGDSHGNGDHHYNNPITNKICINDLEDGSYTLHLGESALELYNKKFTGHFVLPSFLHLSDLFKLKLYCKNIDGIETMFMVVGINLVILEKLVSSKSEIPHIEFLKMLCRYHLAYTETNKFITNSYYYNNNSINQKIEQNTNYIIQNATKPADYTFDNRIEKMDEINVELFEYQKCSVYWMMEKELNKKIILYNLNDEVLLGNVYYDTCTQTFNLVSEKKSLTFNGGAIIDEVGLGKTLEIISLGIKNQAVSISYKSEIHKNKFFSKATLVLCPNQLCGQWVRELKDKIKENYDPKIVSMMTKRDFNKITYSDLLDADFVIVSFTFLDNKAFTLPWTSKISSYKNFHKQKWDKSDIELVDKLFDKLGETLVNDPVDSLFKTNSLIQLIHWHRFVVDEFHEIYKSASPFNYISNLLPFIQANNKWCVTATPFNQNKGLYKIADFLTNYKNLDDTKIYTIEQFIDYFSSNCFRRNTKESVKKEHTLPPIKEEIRWLKFSPTERMIYNAYLADHNNDKFSVYLRQLCCHPQLAEETKEALSNCKTLEDIERMMISHYKLQMDASQEAVDKINEKILKVNKKIKKIERKMKKKHLKKLGMKIDSDSDSDLNDNDLDEELELLILGLDDNLDIKNGIKPSITIENLKDHIKELEKKLKDATNILDGKKSTYNFFNNVVDRIKKTVNKETKKVENLDSFDTSLDSDTNIMNILNKQSKETTEINDDEMCGICLDEIPEDDIGVTKCGHIFCFECLRLTVLKYHFCPYCKFKLTEKDIYVLSYERKKKTVGLSITNDDKNKIELINEIGTKLANLIIYLRESGEHTIIFSQWDDLLRRVGRILKENNILNVFCKGNCYQRDKAIREFNSDDKIKVIMLSSDSTAAGTNLTKASQVIFIDPIYGDYKYRKDQERQAIGRAHRLGQKAKIKIIRFIIKDSVEEEIYKNNFKEDNNYKNDYESLNEIHII